MLSLRRLVPHYLLAWYSSGVSTFGIGDVRDGSGAGSGSAVSSKSG
jgi:hypothetical protein